MVLAQKVGEPPARPGAGRPARLAASWAASGTPRKVLGSLPGFPEKGSFKRDIDRFMDDVDVDMDRNSDMAVSVNSRSF